MGVGLLEHPVHGTLSNYWWLTVAGSPGAGSGDLCCPETDRGCESRPLAVPQELASHEQLAATPVKAGPRLERSHRVPVMAHYRTSRQVPTNLSKVLSEGHLWGNDYRCIASCNNSI